jgi:hypothetical protein
MKDAYKYGFRYCTNVLLLLIVEVWPVSNAYKIGIKIDLISSKKKVKAYCLIPPCGDCYALFRLCLKRI